MNRPVPRWTAGFTFMEVLVAIVTIGFVVTGLAAATVAALQQPNLARENGQALYVARLTMDGIVADRRANGMDGIDSATLSQYTVDGATFDRVLTVTEPDPGNNGCPAAASAGDCKLAALAVTGPEGGVVRATTLFIAYE